MPARKGLTEREGRFIDLYLKCLIAARAAREAGYSIKTARSIAQRIADEAQTPFICSRIL